MSGRSRQHSHSQHMSTTCQHKLSRTVDIPENGDHFKRLPQKDLYSDPTRSDNVNRTVVSTTKLLKYHGDHSPTSSYKCISAANNRLYPGNSGQSQQHNDDRGLARNKGTLVNTSCTLKFSRPAEDHLPIDTGERSNETFNLHHSYHESRSQQENAYSNEDERIMKYVSPKKSKSIDQDYESEYVSDSLNTPDKLNDGVYDRTSMDFVDEKPKGNRIPGVCGLQNLGNTCYMNSALQCLSNIPHMTEFFLQTNLTKGRLAQSYAHLMNEMWSGQYTYVKANEVKECISKYSPIFRGYDQADAREFINVLLNSLHDELKNEDDKSKINDLFKLKIKSQLICERCSYSEDSTEPMKFLALRPNVRNGRRTTLDDLLALFYESKTLNGVLECNHCHELTEHSMKKILDHPLPPVIIVHFTRFNRTRVKDENPIEFPMKYKFDDSNESRYELTGIVSHVGSIYSGHYTAYAKNYLTKKWYYFNDSSTHPIDNPVNEPSIARNAYMLIYAKTKDY